MTFGAEDVQASEGGDFVVLFVSLLLVALEDFVPLLGGNYKLIAGVIPDRAFAIVNFGVNLSLGGTQRLREPFLHAFLLGHELGVAAKQNVGTAASHVGGDGDCAFATGLSHDFRFLFVVLGVEHNVILHALLHQQLREPL